MSQGRTGVGTPTIRPVVSVLFAFAAAFANALNVVTQHVASVAAPAKDKGWRLAVYLIRNPLWLLGVGAMVAGFVFQAVALYHGTLSVVQTILVTELVFSLVIGRLWLRRDVTDAEIHAAGTTSRRNHSRPITRENTSSVTRIVCTTDSVP